jgi:hypothetical protein
MMLPPTQIIAAVPTALKNVKKPGVPRTRANTDYATVLKELSARRAAGQP